MKILIGCVIVLVIATVVVLIGRKVHNENKINHYKY